MSLSSVWRAGACIGLYALLAAGCAHAPRPEPDKPAAPALTPANTTPPERQHYILELLQAGKRDQARVEAQQLVKEQPDNTEAATLLNEIDADPQTLLGAQNTPYTIQPGETLSTLAERFLGDSNLFYALSRYNNIDVPNDAAPGQSILIPSTPRPEHASHAERPAHAEHRETAPALRRREEPAPEARKPRSVPAEPQPQPQPTTPAATAHDPARANSLRSQALVEMNKGDINRAVSLLREASSLDPDSGPISADLARALRIQGATHK